MDEQRRNIFFFVMEKNGVVVFEINGYPYLELYSYFLYEVFFHEFFQDYFHVCVGVYGSFFWLYVGYVWAPGFLLHFRRYFVQILTFKKFS